MDNLSSSVCSCGKTDSRMASGDPVGRKQCSNHRKSPLTGRGLWLILQVGLLKFEYSPPLSSMAFYASETGELESTFPAFFI
jgi:hypothetical protein